MRVCVSCFWSARLRAAEPVADALEPQPRVAPAARRPAARLRWRACCVVGLLGFASPGPAQVFNYLPAAPNVSPGATGWQDVNVSAYVPVGATGVIVQYIETANGGDVDYGVRKKGSTDGFFTDAAKAAFQGWMMTGVDASRSSRSIAASRRSTSTCSATRCPGSPSSPTASTSPRPAPAYVGREHRRGHRVGHRYRRHLPRPEQRRPRRSTTSCARRARPTTAYTEPAADNVNVGHHRRRRRRDRAAADRHDRASTSTWWAT